jgi:uncharacterized coiled-coil DUF342 family protein
MGDSPLKTIIKTESVNTSDPEELEPSYNAFTLKQVQRERIQRSFWVDKEVWDAAACIPGGRTKFIENALADAVAAYKTEIPELELQAEEHRIKLLEHQSGLSATLARIAELKAEQDSHTKEIMKTQANLEQAAIETIRLLESNGKNLMKAHYNRLSELSGIPPKHIESFIKINNYRPSEEQVRDFYLEGLL